MKYSLLGILLFINALSLSGQSYIHTSDIDHFWMAFDSVHTTTDTIRQEEYIRKLYLDKASDGLKEFMAARQHSAQKHLKNIRRYPGFWASIRPYTLRIKSYAADIDTIMNRFSELYPGFKKPEVYFMIGILNSGGTTSKDKILIGAEISVADSTVDASELNAWLRGMFRDNQSIVNMVAHEVVHTQQKESESYDGSLLSQSILEGSCDFIAELLLKRPVSSPYMTYGKTNEDSLWAAFQKEMNGDDLRNWLYNGGDVPHAELGYFIGYMICKSYYEHASNKQMAVKDIIELDYTKDSVLKFLERSHYQRTSTR